LNPRACSKCAYDLTAVPQSAGRGTTCPECGKVHNPSIAPGPCRRCGYDLSGTPVRSDGVAWVCPECRYVSRVEDWGGFSSPTSQTYRRMRWFVAVAALNTLVLVPLLALPLLAAGWWHAAIAGAATLFIIQATARERTEFAVLNGFYRYGRLFATAALLAGVTITGSVMLLLTIWLVSGGPFSRLFR